MITTTIVRRARLRAHQATRRKLSFSSLQNKSRLGYVILATGGVGASIAALYHLTLQDQQLFVPVDAESPRSDDTLARLQQPLLQDDENKRPAGLSIEDNRNLVGSQNQQLSHSWANPGVYVWGLNTGRVVAPDSNDRYIKTPRRLPFFDGLVLRDLKLDKNFAAAINEKGDLLQWGTAYCQQVKGPEVTLKGRNLRSLTLSDDRIIALSDSGKVYSIPVSKERQQVEPRLNESSWYSWKSTPIACRNLTPPDLGYSEKIVSIVGGLQHVLMLTSRGRLYSAASSTSDFPKHGQLGVPGLSWSTRPPGPFDQPHQVAGLQSTTIKQIAAGDTHSLALDKHGRLFSFGDNSHGQLGIQLNTSTINLAQPLNIKAHIMDYPVELPIVSLYPGTRQLPAIKRIAAGGQNTYFVIESQQEPNPLNKSLFPTSRTISDTWSCGRGIWGTLGNGKLTHVQWGPTKIPSLSGMLEYNEITNKLEPIRVDQLNVGSSHVAVVMANMTSTSATSSHTPNNTNWGFDVYFFGNNENFQLGTGKRNNVSTPTHIRPLDCKSAASSPAAIVERLQLAPAKKLSLDGRSVWVEQRVECGRQCSAVYSAAV